MRANCGMLFGSMVATSLLLGVAAGCAAETGTESEGGSAEPSVGKSSQSIIRTGERASFGVFRAGAQLLNRPRVGNFFLDTNMNAVWDGAPEDRQIMSDLIGYAWSWSETPVAGQWLPTGTAQDAPVSRVGTFRDGVWHLDTSGNGYFDGCVTDTCANFGIPGDKPVVVSGNGADVIGVFRNGWFYIDNNSTHVWDAGDGAYKFLSDYQSSDMPVAQGSFIGVFRNGQWFLDSNSNHVFDGCGTDRCGNFGQAGDIPLIYDWAHVAVYRPSTGKWLIDFNLDMVWSGTIVDGEYGFGQLGDKPIMGAFRCGNKGEYCCYPPTAPSGECNGGLLCLSTGCQDPVCPAGQKCCRQSCGSGQVCVPSYAGGQCFAAGGNHQPCRADGSCDAGLWCGGTLSGPFGSDGANPVYCGNEIPACGTLNANCCSNNTCSGTLTCQSGTCKNPPVAPPCSTAGATCCSGYTCGGSWLGCNTSTNKCESCGAIGLKTCPGLQKCDITSVPGIDGYCHECGFYNEPCCPGCVDGLYCNETPGEAWTATCR